MRDRQAEGFEEKGGSWISRFLGVQGLATFVVFFIIFVFLSIASPSFLTAENLIGLLRQVSMLMIASVGMTFLIIAGGIDLSIGSSNAVTGVVCALLVARLGLPVGVGILAGILCGGALGLLNGLMVTQVRLPPLLATLGMMVALRGGAFLITGGHTIYGVPTAYLWIGRGYVGFIPVPVLIMLAIFCRIPVRPAAHPLRAVHVRHRRGPRRFPARRNQRPPVHRPGLRQHGAAGGPVRGDRFLAGSGRRCPTRA